MADRRSTAALAAAERLYKRKPDATTEEFRKVCERADPGNIGKLDNREFNASYVLPFRRSAALRGKTGGKRRKKKTARKAARATGPKNGRKTRKKAKKARKTTKATKRKARRTAAAAASVDFGTVQRVAQMIRERDAELLAAAGDLNRIYDIAAHVEAFAAEVVEASGD
jgi:hypothetical protein